MLRMLRIIGVVLFAFLVGLSANSLREMQESGALLEKYNSQRKADITLLVFSFMALGGLGYFELDRFNRASRRRTYADGPVPEEPENAEGLDSASIYAAPQTVERWGGRRTRSSKPHTSKSRNKVIKDDRSIRLILLKVMCMVLPVLYLGLMMFNLMSDHEDTMLDILLPSLFGGLLLLSLATLIGVMAKKLWGLKLGYILALFNLLIFPTGTIAGLFLIMGLVAASSVFAEFAMTRRRNQGRSASRASAAI